MSDLTLRNATPDDAASICDIWNPIIRNTVITFNPVERGPAEITAMIGERQAGGHAFMLAESGGRVLGFASYAQFRGGLGYSRCMEHTINLSDAARGKGAGRALLLALEDHARRAGNHVMVGAITASNTASVGFHAALGYETVGTMPQVGWKFGQYHDLVLMQKFL
ncbi:GNAT family N-acetyltransferase [Roseinatronobacter alkalisoli]|uniref:GNAT family N-acetyltransferase n=1 Tax=Roseinatronobacter alkalisoli TaxID=3028235 RepID=A0ABT5T652_9RHOB|nr:GNAT family N-acetyltransferase [Roseinatronobacter sp. HJB301]MDD7970524.1 GNAT family N-acetyltransferase [Roseinatronobacter sp. HJB301]